MNDRNFDYHAAAALTNVLSNPVRLRMVFLLIKSEMSVNAICASVGLSQSAVSQHLKKLKDLGVLETRRQNQTIYYSVPALAPVRKFIDMLWDIAEVSG